MQRYNNSQDIQAIRFYGLSILFFIISIPLLCFGYIDTKPIINPSNYIKVNATIISAYDAIFYNHYNELIKCKYLAEFDDECLSEYMCKKKREYYYPIGTKSTLLYLPSSGYCRTEQFTNNLVYVGFIFFGFYIFSCVGLCFNIYRQTNIQPISYEIILHNSTNNNKYIKIYDAFECSVCSIAFNDDKFILKKCGHIFHKKCIDDWLNKKNICPLCKENIT